CSSGAHEKLLWPGFYSQNQRPDVLIPSRLGQAEVLLCHPTPASIWFQTSFSLSEKHGTQFAIPAHVTRKLPYGGITHPALDREINGEVSLVIRQSRILGGRDRDRQIKGIGEGSESGINAPIQV